MFLAFWSLIQFDNDDYSARSHYDQELRSYNKIANTRNELEVAFPFTSSSSSVAIHSERSGLKDGLAPFYDWIVVKFNIISVNTRNKPPFFCTGAAANVLAYVLIFFFSNDKNHLSPQQLSRARNTHNPVTSLIRFLFVFASFLFSFCFVLHNLFISIVHWLGSSPSNLTIFENQFESWNIHSHTREEHSLKLNYNTIANEPPHNWHHYWNGRFVNKSKVKRERTSMSFISSLICSEWKGIKVEICARIDGPGCPCVLDRDFPRLIYGT